jgi:putative oxidoreductase
VQRLFSTFPEGWPGTGLLFLRAVVAVPPFQLGILRLLPATASATVIPQLIATGAAALLLAGLWTPVAGVLMAIAELCLAFLYPAEPWMHILLGALGAGLAMLGPGAWSVDARLFGRKRIRIPQR